MFFAIHKETGKLINSLELEFSIEFMKEAEWYIHPSYIENIPENIEKSKIIVNYRQGADDIINFKGTVYSISPHFYLPNTTEKGIIIRKNSKEHNIAVSFIAHLLRSENSFIISNNKEHPQKIKIEEGIFSLDKIDIEVTITSKNVRRADILLPLKEFHPLLGFGVVFEIQLSPQSEKETLERSFDRANKGYSVCWVWDTKSTDLNVDLYSEIIKNYTSQLVTNIKEITLNYSDMIGKRTLELEKKYEEFKSLLIEPPFVGLCKKCNEGYMILKKGTSKKNKPYKGYFCTYCDNKIWY